MKRLTPSSWSYERIPNLKQNLKFEIVKLDGENIFDRVLPGYKEYKNLETSLNNQLDNNLIDFYQNYKNVRFPKNSYCYRLKESQWNQSYISEICTSRADYANVGLRPTILLWPAGTRPEPAVSVPKLKGTIPLATTTDEPELEPPLIYSGLKLFFTAP